MYLLLNIDDFLGEILGINFKDDLYEKISQVTGRSKRQASDYMRKKNFPAGSHHRIKSWLSSQGLTFFEGDLPGGSEIAIGWLSFLQAIQQHPPELIPITYQRIRDFAEKDIEFLRRIRNLGKEERFASFKEYLLHQVIPEYCTDVEQVSSSLAGKNDFDEIKEVLAIIFIESLLCVLSQAEAEYLLKYCSNQNSVLSRCIPTLGEESIDSPSKKFIRLWMDALSLSRKDVVNEMVDHFGEAGVAEQDNESGGVQGVSKDAVEKQLQRYLNEGRCPSWETVEKWSQGLYWRAVEIQGRTEGHQSYSQLTMDIYGGVKMLDKIYSEGRKTIPEPGDCKGFCVNGLSVNMLASCLRT